MHNFENYSTTIGYKNKLSRYLINLFRLFIIISTSKRNLLYFQKTHKTSVMHQTEKIIKTFVFDALFVS